MNVAITYEFRSPYSCFFVSFVVAHGFVQSSLNQYPASSALESKD